MTRQDQPATAGPEEERRTAGVEALELDSKSDLERPLAGGERHGYGIGLLPGEYLHVEVEPTRVDVTLELSAPGGRLLPEVDSPDSATATETLELVATVPGRHRLEVHAMPGSSSGRYRIRIVAWRSATSRDRDRAAAMQAMARGHGLRRQRSLEATRDAIEMFEAAAQGWASVGEPLEEASALYWLGAMYRELGELQEAVRRTQRSLELFRSAGAGGERIPSILGRLGRLYRELNDESRALASQREALELARELEDRQKEAAYLNNIAVTYREFGRTRQALRSYEEALARCREICEPREVTTMQINLGAFYSTLGRFRRARILLEDALRLSRESGNVRSESRALSQLGAVQRRLGRPAEALESLKLSLALQDTERNARGRALALEELGRTYSVLGESAAAKENLERSLEIYRRLNNRRGEAQVRSELGWLLIKLGDAEGALVELEQALRLFRVAGSRGGEASALHAIARAERQRDDVASARRRIEQAIEIVESLRSQTEISELRAAYLAHKQDYYGFYIDLLVDLHHRQPTAGYDALAFTVSEQRRARSLLDDLIAAQARPARDQDSRLLDQLRELQRSVDGKDRELDHLRQDEAARDQIVKAERDLEELLMARERLRARIAAGTRETDRLPPRLDLQQVQELLDPETLLLEIALGKTRSFLWLVTPATLELRVLPERAVIEKRAKDAYRLLAQSDDRRTRDQLELVTGELSRLLLEPVAKRLGKQRLLLVSDAALQYVPFAALPIPRGHPAAPTGESGSRLMVTAHEIVQVPSLSVLSFLSGQASARPPPSKILAVVADPVFGLDDSRFASGARQGAGSGKAGLPPLDRLPGSGAEAKKILSLVPEAERFSAVGFDASHETVLSGILAGYRYVHFATHSLFDPERPEVSGLALSRFDRQGQMIQPSILRDHEVLRLDLSVEMVVLSACRTGLGREIRGEGLVGLTQGFLYAGASRVLVSFWPVDDKGTAELMVRFYLGILEGGRQPADALRQAQLSMLRQKRWQEPYYWAGFFLQGEWR